MSLESRTKAFDGLMAKAEADGIPSTCLCRPHPLMLIAEMPDGIWDVLRYAAILYLSRQARREDGCPSLLTEQRILDHYQFGKTYVLDVVTPNGMIVPKRHSALEFNVFMRALAGMAEWLNLRDFVRRWHVPPNLRVKLAEADTESVKRSHPSELVHSDSWAGESSESVMLYAPLLGDADRNFVRFYAPPADFQESWLTPLPSYRDGQELAKRFTPLDVRVKKGEVALVDFAVLHASERQSGAGLRFSLDTTFVMRRQGHDGAESIHPARANEFVTWERLRGVGEQWFFYFPDGVTDRRDNAGGFKHPSRMEQVSLPCPTPYFSHWQRP